MKSTFIQVYIALDPKSHASYLHLGSSDAREYVRGHYVCVCGVIIWYFYFYCEVRYMIHTYPSFVVVS